MLQVISVAAGQLLLVIKGRHRDTGVPRAAVAALRRHLLEQYRERSDDTAFLFSLWILVCRLVNGVAAAAQVRRRRVPLCGRGNGKVPALHSC